jgi:hypothetical protein
MGDSHLRTFYASLRGRWNGHGRDRTVARGSGELARGFPPAALWAGICRICRGGDGGVDRRSAKAERAGAAPGKAPRSALAVAARLGSRSHSGQYACDGLGVLGVCSLLEPRQHSRRRCRRPDRRPAGQPQAVHDPPFSSYRSRTSGVGNPAYAPEPQIRNVVTRAGYHSWLDRRQNSGRRAGPGHAPAGRWVRCYAKLYSPDHHPKWQELLHQ